MEIQEKLLKFKLHIIFAPLLSLVLVLISLIILAPSFLTILAYFWPLFLSTALFLVTVIFFGKASVSSSSSAAAAEGLLDYVAGTHHPAAAELEQPSHHDEASAEESFKSQD